MFGACCCANAEGGDAIGQTIEDFPRKEEITMPELPAAVTQEKPPVAPTPAPPPLSAMNETSAASGGSATAAGKKECGSSSAPMGPGTTFNASIVRKEDDPIGLDIDLIDSISAVVVDIKDGAIRNWNMEHPDLALKVNDRIVEVNGVRFDSNNMVAKLKSDTTWAIQVQRPSEFMISISRANAPSLGMDLRYAPNGTTLMITQVGDGPMQEWNKAHPDKVVCKHDRIIQLNGISGTPTQLLHASEDSEMLNMVIIHYPQTEQ